MKKNSKIVVIGILILGILIQFIPSNKNQSAITPSSDFITMYSPPTNIANKLKVSCYDCHSNNTYYPWYNKIQPIAWFLENHINEAKEELNFSDFGNYSKRKQKSKVKSILSQIKDDEMPLKTYTFMHKNAKFTKKEIDEFEAYFTKYTKSIK